MIDWHTASPFILATTKCLNCDFCDIGIALLSIALVFPILDKLTGKSIDDFKGLRKKVEDNGSLRKADSDELISRIDDTIDHLTQKSVLNTFRNTILLAFIFLVLSTGYNTYQKVLARQSNTLPY